MISVVMPTYNSEKYVKKAAESILSQTYGDFEFLVINEYGSNDGTVSILESLHDSRIGIIQNRNRLGIAESLNEGIRQAKGKYIARMDSDDISLPHRFETQLAFMENRPLISVCGSWSRFFGKMQHIHRTPATHDEIKAALMFSCDMVHSSVMIRRRDIIEKGLWYDSDYAAEDYDLWTRAVHSACFANIQKVLLLYRYDSENATIKNMPVLYEQEQRIYKRTLRLLDIDYTPYLIGGWESCLYDVPRQDWQTRLTRTESLLFEILKQNQIKGIYVQEHLRHFSERQFLRNLVLDKKRFSDEAGMSHPFECISYAISALAKKRASGRDVCVFGLGEIGSRLLPVFKENFGERLCFVSDNDSDKWGAFFAGIKCVAPRELPDDICVFISVNPDALYEIRAQLKDIGLKYVYSYYGLCKGEDYTE
jgi:glycosyltransferase involved in cell wall biosynthesis